MDLGVNASAEIPLEAARREELGDSELPDVAPVRAVWRHAEHGVVVPHDLHGKGARPRQEQLVVRAKAVRRGTAVAHHERLARPEPDREDRAERVGKGAEDLVGQHGGFGVG